MAAPRGDIFGNGGGVNLLYAITSCQKQENSPNVVTCIIKMINFDVFSFLYSGASLSFVTLYVANYLDVILDKLCEPFVFLHMLRIHFLLREYIVITSFLSITKTYS